MKINLKLHINMYKCENIKLRDGEIWNYNDRIMGECEMDMSVHILRDVSLISYKLYCIYFTFIRET